MWALEPVWNFLRREKSSNVNKNPADATVCRYLFTAKLLYMFRVSQQPSSGVLKTYLHTVASVGFLFTLNYDARNHELKIIIIIIIIVFPLIHRVPIRPRWRGVAVQVV